VHEYLDKVEIFSKLIREYKFGPRSMIILAAAVSDFYIPFDEMSEHKISSTNDLSLTFKKVPKKVGLIKEICPET